MAIAIFSAIGCLALLVLRYVRAHAQSEARRPDTLAPAFPAGSTAPHEAPATKP